jgi:hypothetical protein
MVVILSSNSEGCIVCIICKLTHLWGAAFHVSCCVRQVKGLYKGATSAFVGVALESSVLFGAYSQAKAALQVGIIWRGVLFTESLTGMS